MSNFSKILIWNKSRKISGHPLTDIRVTFHYTFFVSHHKAWVTLAQKSTIVCTDTFCVWRTSTLDATFSCEVKFSGNKFYLFSYKFAILYLFLYTVGKNIKKFSLARESLSSRNLNFWPVYESSFQWKVSNRKNRYGGEIVLIKSCPPPYLWYSWYWSEISYKVLNVANSWRMFPGKMSCLIRASIHWFVSSKDRTLSILNKK